MEDMIANGQLKMDAMDLGKKSAVEKELEVMSRLQPLFLACHRTYNTNSSTAPQQQRFAYCTPALTDI